MKTITLPIKNSMKCSPSQGGLLLIMLLLAWFWVSPTVQAVVPAPDGGYPSFNTAEGTDALFNLTTGIENTANGFAALLSNTTGSFNTANGVNALFHNTTGGSNTANGANALLSNTTGNTNTAVGLNALLFNNGSQNVAVGGQALQSNTTGFQNTANGFQALFFNTTGFHNTADGFQALFSNTTGNHNTADGDFALHGNTTGNFNTANGAHTLVLNTTGSSNIALGFNAGDNLTIGNNNIDIGNVGGVGESSTIRIGTEGTQTNTFIAGIHGVAVTGAAVVVSSSGQLGVAPSSVRFKNQIKPMDKASEAILALKPVTYRYKRELDPEGIPQFGLVAEQVEKVNPDLVARDAKGEVYTVRYEAVNAMLLNEFLKEHLKVEEQQATIGQLKQDFLSKLAEQQKQIKALASGLEKISNQLELNKPAPQMVAKNQ
jgi:endosialidase-like protein